MEKQIITQRITAILDDISRLQSALYAMSTTDLQRYHDNYEVLSTDAALRGENIACRLRHLIYATTGIKKSEYMQSAAVMQGVQIHCENGMVEITLPALLPKRKQRQSSEFLLDPIYFALSGYADSHTLPKFTHCVVCFSHIYCRDLPARRVRDYDNLELKQLLDVVSTFIMADDSGLLCDAYNTTELGDTDCTRISVMDQDHFFEWLEERKNSVKAISDF
ncbi:MAG: DUF6100 family protein [Oscillospiraceae bacterium]|nr:DUF6100 family protein [Oscillospiraceae bacterium]